MGTIFSSMKTTVTGILVLICTGTSVSGVLGDKWNSLLQLICGVLIAFGFIAAKDADVSNAPNPGEANVVD